MTGVVKDASGEPIIGASVVEAGTTNGIVTDLDGNFKLNVSAKGSLKISFIGYQTQTIPVAGKKQFDITLKEDAKVLDEVVVVGYGQMKRSDLTGSVVSVNDEAIKKSVVTSVDRYCKDVLLVCRYRLIAVCPVVVLPSVFVVTLLSV